MCSCHLQEAKVNNDILKMAFAKLTKKTQKLEVYFDVYVQIFVITKCC